MEDDLGDLDFPELPDLMTDVVGNPEGTSAHTSGDDTTLMARTEANSHEQPLGDPMQANSETLDGQRLNRLLANPSSLKPVDAQWFLRQKDSLVSSGLEAVARAFDLGQINVLVATSVAEEGLDVPDTRVAIMLDGITSGRVRVQCRGRVMRRPGGAFHILYYTGSAEDVGVWRSQQQVDASHKALEELAADPQAIASLSVGPNPLVQLNTLKQKGIVEGPQFEGTEHSVNGMFHVTVTLTLVKTGREIVAAATDKNKRKAKAAAVERAVATLLEGQSAELR
ncbi:hypothetical protein EMIHUDRAFT_243843 [Emiliania huxleyi CCMP1516]|uniref:Helicase C-terminal domain-containing protein n=2 Tax=Emiliania huxleyi TaxID=2903 RepID=A0A0D3J2F6_EMIH1|nr:hypothetical protein EMIHUDRAFT_243843 [Emiliania huxleyi CCMP1516]EOD17691.1 hypothetical protein EMIHUDRAFT_243843 [Emiliania huxleyi CCMP1516]|eukprot:XP_005770120.1 hypothetical protein EMIHUDRAFT_243843 [Emiliania huxleyi CCMP1516]